MEACILSRGKNSSDETKIRALKKRVKYLERENGRLRKQNNRMEPVVNDFFEDEESEMAAEPIKVVKQPFQCVRCKGTEYEVMPLSVLGVPKSYLLCKGCKKTQPVKE